MTDFQQKLFELQDKEYALFQAKLTPTVAPELFIGVRVPLARKLAKQLFKEQDCEPFLKDLPHKYFDENMLHTLLLNEQKDFEGTVSLVESFLPYIDNWAVCDILSPKVFKKHKAELMPLIKKWSSSKDTYTCRFGVEMLMSHFLDDDFLPEYLEISASIHSDEYYVNMMIAWFFATALAKQWDDTIPYIQNGKLDIWCHNKAIQKARESYRITDEQKQYLKTLKR